MRTSEERFSEEMIKIQEYGFQLMEYRMAGGNEIPISQHEQLLEAYIESLHHLEKSHEDFNKAINMFTELGGNK